MLHGPGSAKGGGAHRELWDKFSSTWTGDMGGSGNKRGTPGRQGARGGNRMGQAN